MGKLYLFYWQIYVKPEHRWLTAFVTDFGLFEWVRMPFGLKCYNNCCSLCEIFAIPMWMILLVYIYVWTDEGQTGQLAVALRASACIFANNAQSWPGSEIGEM